MRRRVGLCAAAVISLLAGLSAPAAAYAPSPSTGAAPPPAAGAGQTVCTPNASQVSEISGLVATATGYFAINDSPPPGGKAKIYALDAACKLVGSPILYPTAARDPEDLAIDKNGTLWIADVGDNDEASGGSKDPRPTVAVWSLPAGAKEPTINRLQYPDGKKHDAEAILLSGDGTPIIITKSPPSEVWVPEGPLVPKADKGVKLRKAGTFTAQETKTANPLGLLGWKLVTGAASSPDGTKVVIRTYSDAYEFDVAGGDVVKAITTGKPRITPLPNETQGEAITYTPDGKNYVTASDVESSKKAAPLLRYTPTNITPDKAGGANLPTPSAKDQSFLQSLTLSDITWAVAAIGIVGLILVVAGIVGIRRSRRSRRSGGSSTGPIKASASIGGPPDAFDGASDDGGTVYGGRPALSAPANRGAPGGTVYGAGPPPSVGGPPPGGGPSGRDASGRGRGDQRGFEQPGGQPDFDQEGPSRGFGQGGFAPPPPPPPPGAPGGGRGQQRGGPPPGGGYPPPAPPAGGTYGAPPRGAAPLGQPDQRRVHGRGPQPDDHDGYERGYAPHR